MEENAVEPEDLKTPEGIRKSIIGANLTSLRNMLKTFVLDDKWSAVANAAEDLQKAFDVVNEPPAASTTTVT
jgi:hypothetical protein